MNPSPLAPRKPALRWHGAKWRLAPWILSQLPDIDSHDVYVEPFAGSAAILLRKPRSLIEIYNDLDKEIVNFFKMLRHKPQDLIALINMTPYSQVEWDLAHNPGGDALEQARRFYVRSHMSINGPSTQWTNGFRRQTRYSRGKSGKSSMKPAPHTFADINHLWVIADRLKGVFIEYEDAYKCMERYDSPETLFYVDPPYLGSTRKRNAHAAYQHEIQTDKDHTKLLLHLQDLKGMVALSGYDSQLYNDMLPTWSKHQKSARTNGPGKTTETLWLNHVLISRKHFSSRKHF